MRVVSDPSSQLAHAAETGAAPLATLAAAARPSVAAWSPRVTYGQRKGREGSGAS